MKEKMGKKIRHIMVIKRRGIGCSVVLLTQEAYDAWTALGRPALSIFKHAVSARRLANTISRKIR